MVFFKKPLQFALFSIILKHPHERTASPCLCSHGPGEEDGKGKSCFLVPLFSTWEIINKQLLAPVQTDYTLFTQRDEGKEFPHSIPRAAGRWTKPLFSSSLCLPKTASAVMAPSLQFWPWLALFCRETAFNKYQQEFSLGSFWEGVTGARALR